MRWLQPREPDAAARDIRVVYQVASAAAVIGLLLVPPSTSITHLVLTIAAFAVGAALVVPVTRLLPRARPAVWAIVPVFGVAALVAVDLVVLPNQPASLLFFFCPVLYAAAQLPPPGGRAITALSILGAGIVAFSSSGGRPAVLNLLFVAVALGVCGWVIAKSEAARCALVAQLRRQAAIDPLTGLVTRRVLDEAARSALTGAQSHHGTVLILIDIDHFKQINDRYGHPCGDEVLRWVATMLTARSRPDDIVCRIGGDEIAVLLPGAPLAAGLLRAEQIIEDVRTAPFVSSDGLEMTVTLSVGVAHAPTDAHDLRSLYAAADTVLYAAKRAGRNQLGQRSSLAATEQP
ncbi:GGDEF domain-containing protein [Nakamurella sp. YIM 132084]|uniref:GGDEF domain-containing protein n=1 Tax=Nakamurella leprariae TaxID=2803911 RepID=A0A938YJU7_9ACTN|nr:GGDEF domain-containing protein [Nakamurella leprariae]